VKVGDLVKYRGWSHNASFEHVSRSRDPLAIVVQTRAEDSEYHKRIRVMWVGEEIPIQAQVVSTNGNRFSSWCSPKYFHVVSKKGD